MISNQPKMINTMKTFASKSALIITLALALGLTACHQQYNHTEQGGKQAPRALQQDITEATTTGSDDSMESNSHNTEAYDRKLIESLHSEVGGLTRAVHKILRTSCRALRGRLRCAHVRDD